MPSNNTKYSEEMRTQTAAYILESGKSATSVAEEMRIDKNTVCKWVRDYRRAQNLPTYAEENGIKMPPPREIKDDRARNIELGAKLKVNCGEYMIHTIMSSYAYKIVSNHRHPTNRISKAVLRRTPVLPHHEVRRLVSAAIRRVARAGRA